jgi:hypothetical protein
MARGDTLKRRDCGCVLRTVEVARRRGAVLATRRNIVNVGAVPPIKMTLFQLQLSDKEATVRFGSRTATTRCCYLGLATIKLGL